MALLPLLVSVTKVAGVLAAITVAANAISYSRYRKRNLHPFNSPIDESVEVLADFNTVEVSETGERFFFGLATAPAHVEDKLNDAWLEFAMENPCGNDETTEKPEAAGPLLASAAGDGGSQPASLPKDEPEKPSLKKRKSVKLSVEAMIRGFEKYAEGEDEEHDHAQCGHTVAAWHNVYHPEERLRFWSDPDAELKLAKDTGVSVFRMGIDWTRVMPKEPQNNLRENVDFAALERYRWIIERARSYGMRVMATLFHHSLPPWAGEYGGWRMEKTVDYFMDFTRLVVDRVSDLVDYWVTFNEPHVFCMLTYCAGAWPGGHPDMLEVVTSALPTGIFHQTMHWIAVAHSKAYDYIHSESTSKQRVGVAHHVSFTRPFGLFDVASVKLAISLTLFPFIDSVSNKLDFIGINYYGQEVFSGPGLKLVDDDEYSESGRGVYPDGLYRILLQFHERYRHLQVPFIITENGISDETDIIRRPYLLEHLLAIYAAITKGVPVIGYLFWTMSDNWEWADGYGPKFGLVAVDRANDLARHPRSSYHLFTKVVKTGKVTWLDRAQAWRELQTAAKEQRTRPFYRYVNKHGLMYAGGLDEPIRRPFVQRDWRFGHYKMEGLQDPVSCLVRFVVSPFSRKKLEKNDQADDDSSSLVLQPVASQSY